MNDSVAVQVLDSSAYLIHVALRFQLVQSLPPAQEFVEGLVVAELQQDVHVLSVLEEVLEPHDVVVVQTPVDLNLRHELLLGSGLGEGSLCDDLGG